MVQGLACHNPGKKRVDVIYTRDNTVGEIYIAPAISIASLRFFAYFLYPKNFFLLFSFVSYHRRQFHTHKKKSFEFFFLSIVNLKFKKVFFFRRVFLTPFFWTCIQFLRNVKLDKSRGPRPKTTLQVWGEVLGRLFWDILKLILYFWRRVIHKREKYSARNKYSVFLFRRISPVLGTSSECFRFVLTQI